MKPTSSAAAVTSILLVVFLIAFLTRKRASTPAAVHGDVTEGDGFTVTEVDPSSVNSPSNGGP
jgi:hypothetical protein